jgi:hypothetical protein
MIRIDVGGHIVEGLPYRDAYEVRIDGAVWLCGATKRQMQECLALLVASYAVKPTRVACPVCARQVGVNQHQALVKHDVPEGKRRCSGTGVKVVKAAQVAP